MKKKIILIICGGILAFLFSIILDRVLGVYLGKVGYFKVLIPNITEIYDTSEFNTTAKISSIGIRNQEISTQKPKKTLRILVLGDSFTFGWGVEQGESWPKLLEKSIKLKDKNIEIVNTGVPGAGLDDEILICQAYKRLQSDAVILGFYMLDDLYDVAGKEQNENLQSKFISEIFPNLTKLSKPIIGQSWYKASEGSRVVSSGYWRKQAQVFLSQNPAMIENIDPQIKNDFINGKLNPGNIIYGFYLSDFWIKMLDKANLDFALKAADKRFAKLKKICGKNLPVIVLGLPSYELVSRDFFKYRLGEGFKVDNKLLTFNIDSLLKDTIDRNELFYISILPEFRKDGCKGCYYLWDGHLRKEGHIRVNQIITPILQNIFSN